MPREIQVRNPRTGAADHTIVAASDDEIIAAAGALRARQGAWAAQPVERRIEALRAFGEAITRHRDELIARLETDTGRRWVSHLEVDSVLSAVERACRFAADAFAPDGPAPTSDPEVQVTGDLVPYPVVAVISPWNFPFQLALIDAVPALLAGSAVLLKPSEVTPRFIPVLRACVAEVEELAGVFTVVEGDGATGAAMVAVADAVCFTGSVRTGRAVGRAAAEHFIPAFLELGGKDPAIVTASADLDAASSAILWGSTINSGHSCMSIERVYVDRTVVEEFTELLVAKAERVALAYPEIGDGQIGPIISDAQVDVIREQLEEAVAKGATVRTGGTVQHLGGGAYLRPTVLTGVDHSMRVMREETFGPIIPIMPFDDEDEAVTLANDTEFGLSAAVFAATAERAAPVAHRLEAGAVSVNDVCLTGMFPETEKNSFKSSGLGASRMGPPSVRRFLRRRALLMRAGAGIRPWYYDGAPAETEES
ncbi:aldehyde dehydrogenase family protein [Nonomuraea sp. MCN248]|uniref:Aldehyde dehydrogenase family protein n=1 Tax=Nonomuraea corallina TaxID=2989783 RepID=A0ABT4SBW3_9ACTN|nr:aldehyde dehydrogenase family protein [Nonomuraea corallina]MDA0634687.1 aldehyde dehydrogenase family protein [Nonomuraea corallina]